MGMSDLLVTIIVPIYNVEKYLRKCVDSIIGQTYSSLEIILVDDGSTDDSSKICDEYKEKDERIVVVHKQNGGLSSSRNAGLSRASGEYVLFIDGDDWIRKDTVKTLLAISQEKQIGVVQMGIYHIWDENEEEQKEENIQIEIVNREECFKKLYSGPDYVSMCNKLIAKEYWKELCFPEGYLFEDMYVNYKLFAALDEVAVCDAKMYFYRQHSDSICKKNSIYEHEDYFNALMERCEYYKQNNYYDSYKAELIYHMFFYIECYLCSKKSGDSVRKKNIKKFFSEERKILNRDFKVKRMSWWLFDVWPALYIELRKIYVTFCVKRSGALDGAAVWE